MDSQFVVINVPIVPLAGLRGTIEHALRVKGEPLRWAITAIEGNSLRVEAVVTQEPEPAVLGIPEPFSVEPPDDVNGPTGLADESLIGLPQDLLDPDLPAPDFLDPDTPARGTP
jgi:hypothetical protein